MPRPNRTRIDSHQHARAVLSTGVGLIMLLADNARAQAPTADPTPRSVRITMQALHQLGGVPPGWSLSPPSGDAVRGRATYERLGCHSCHVVRGAAFPAPTGPGPELTGMGSHHPAAYFVESIVNPSAVVVDGPGYVGSDGQSTMPTYPDMSLAQLGDLVAYLRSLQSGESAQTTPPTPGSSAAAPDLPAPPPAGT